MKTEDLDNCMCLTCPSYSSCNNIGFCLNGKNPCATSLNGCICMHCPVHKTFNLRSMYYCTHGAEEQLRK